MKYSKIEDLKHGDEVTFNDKVRSNNKWRLAELLKVKIIYIHQLKAGQSLPRMTVEILEGITYQFDSHGKKIHIREKGSVIRICNNNLILLSSHCKDAYEIF